MTISCVLIIPATLQEKANTLAIYMGWGPNNYSVPLSSTGTLPASHYGLHTWATETFMSMMNAAGQGQMPQELVDAGYPPEDFSAVLGSLIVSMQSDSEGHFLESCVANNLTRIEEEVL